MVSYVLDPAIRLVDGMAHGHGRTFGAFHARRERSRWFVYGHINGDTGGHVIARIAGRGFSRRKVFGRPTLTGFRTKAEAAAVALQIGKE